MPSAQVLTLQITGAIKLPPNQKRERTGKKRLKGHGPEHNSPFLISLMVYVDVKHHVYLLTYTHSIIESKHVLVLKTFTPNFRPSWGFFKACPVGLTDSLYIYIAGVGWGVREAGWKHE